MSASDQFIEYIIDQFAQGAQTNLQTPGRHGNMVVLTKAMADEVLITGDLHGNRENFNLIKKMAALDAHPRRHLVLQELCHGGPTYAQNNGCMSHTILEDAVILKNKYPRQVHIILGNHELAELTDYPIQKNGQLLNVQFRLGLQHMYGAAAEKIRQSYLPFIQTCPLAVRLPQNEFLSHSIPENCDSQTFDAGVFQHDIDFHQLHEDSPLFQLVWGRDFRYENA
ncbi:MAG: metallophosphoesterase, partial [Thermoguttaceae bacterium]